MFSKAKQPQTPSRTFSDQSQPAPEKAAPSSAAAPMPSASGTIPSIISADLQINGDLKSTGDIQVDGQIKGDVHSKTMTIGETAQINGSLTGDRIRICGSVTGSVRGPSVILAKTAKVLGDIIHESLEIEAGAFIEGNIMRLDSTKSNTGGARPAAASNGAATRSTPASPAARGGKGEKPAVHH